MLPRFLSRESTLGVALAVLLFWAPLPGASVTPGAELFYRLAAFGLLAVALMTQEATLRWPAASAPAALAAMAALGLAQSLRWPAALVGLLSREHLLHYRLASGAVGGDADIAWVPLSLDAAVTRSSAVAWFAAAALLAVVLVVGRRARHRRWLLAALVGAALVQIGVGLVRLEGEFVEGLGEVLLRPWGRLKGAFPNPNSLSLLFEMALVAVAAWCWYALRRAVVTRRWWGALPPICLWLVLLAAIVLTGSRAGIAAALVATLVQAAVLPVIGRRRKVALLLILLVVTGLAGLIMVGDRMEISRYEVVSLYEDNLYSRLRVIGPCLELWRRFPVTGTGLGTFQDAFPLVAPAELAPALWNRAHNDPLELLVTGGTVGLSLGALAVLLLLWPIGRALRSARRTEERAVVLAALGALAAAGLHELTDFGLVMPANSLALLSIVGSAAAVGLRRTAEPPS